jgi:hypothetical protein
MRLKRLFNKPKPADPFAVFAETYHIRIPKDTPPPKAEPDEPQPVELDPTRAHQLLGVPLGASRQEVSLAYKKTRPHASPGQGGRHGF